MGKSEVSDVATVNSLFIACSGDGECHRMCDREKGMGGKVLFKCRLSVLCICLVCIPKQLIHSPGFLSHVSSCTIHKRDNFFCRIAMKTQKPCFISKLNWC